MSSTLEEKKTLIHHQPEKSLKKDEEKLVESVRRYSCLWQVSSTVFKDLWAKENTWKEVDSQVQNYMEVNHKQFGTTICIYRANQL